MPIKFKYDLAAVAPWSNKSTRDFGESLVEQQRQQNFAGQQLRQQLGARDFQNATSNMSSYLQDMLDNGEITDEPTRRRLLALRSGVDTVMGSGFTDDQRRHYLNQYNSQIAGILANAPVKAKPTRDDELKGFLGSNYDKYKDQPWVPDGKGGFTIADIPQPEQPKLPEPTPPQPKTFGEYYQMEPENARKMLADKMAEIQDSISIGEGSIAPYKSVQDKALAELEKPFQIMQDKFGQPTQAPPSAGALPAPTTGASTGGSQGNAWGGIAQASGPLPAWRTEGRQFTYASQPDVGDMRGAPAGQVSPGVDRSGTFDFSNLRGAVAQNNYNAQLDAMRTPMTPEQIAALDAQTNATMDSTNAQPAKSQARAAEINAGYAPRTNSLKRQADAMSNKTDRAESALRSELLPRSPQGERPSSMYDISDAKDKREAKQYAANQAEYDKYKAKRAEGDAALQNPTKPNVNRIEDPETMKQAARKFSSDYQIYKRGGGTLSTRDYIRQRVAQSTSPEDMSPDLIRQLENMYGMDLGSQAMQDVVEQDINAPREYAMQEAKSKRDAKYTRRKYASGGVQTTNSAAPVATSAVSDATRPKRGLPGGYVPTEPEQKYVAPQPSAPVVSAEQQARSGPDFSALEKQATDEADRRLIQQIKGLAGSGQPPEVTNALYMMVNPSASEEEIRQADAYLMSKGIDVKTMAAKPPTKPKSQRSKGMRGAYDYGHLS